MNLTYSKTFDVLFLAICAFCPYVHAQQFENQVQQAERGFQANVEKPRFAQGKGPVVAIDGAHYNFHKLDGRYGPFAKVLEAD
ncbi:MAG: hypothetical protein AAF483_04685, partial [Planctomycetota bacterium]